MSLMRFQHGVADRPTASESCWTVLRASRCSSTRIFRLCASREGDRSAIGHCEKKTLEARASPIVMGKQFPRTRKQHPTMNAPLPSSALQRADVRLSDSLWAPGGTIYLTGTQALVRLLAMQRQRDEAAGLNTNGFVSGYRGSPLGMVDLAVWKAGPRLAE